MGSFSVTIPAAQLRRGLRPSKRSPRNTGLLIECEGAVGRDGVLQAIDDLTRINTSSITDGFPFPQMFVFTNVIIVCGLKKIYEWVGGALSLKYTAAAAGGTWSAIESGDYIYLTNGSIAVVRDAGSKAYALSSTLPHATAACNFNGQVIIGAPNEDGLGADIMIPAGVLTVTTSQQGSITTT